MVLDADDVEPGAVRRDDLPERRGTIRRIRNDEGAKLESGGRFDRPSVLHPARRA
jgi:hypothetical protein